MRAQDLRIGNYVNSKYDTAIKLEALLAIGVLQNGEGIRSGWVLSYDELEPIPLTEDWLLNFGAMEIRHPEIQGAKRFLIKGGTCIVDYMNHRGFYYGGMLAGYKGLQYVHQLQNLFYALTGEELTVKHGSLQAKA